MTSKQLPDAYYIADGLALPELRRRAAQAAAWAVEAKTRYTSILDVEKRGQAVIAKVAWEDIVAWTEESDGEVFSLQAYQDEDDAVSRPRRAWEAVRRWTSVVGFWRAFRELFGKDRS